MNNLVNALSVFFLTAILFTACSEDVCKNKSCDNGTCDTVSGRCLCSNGYQNDANGICTIEWTTKFIGAFNVSDSCVGSHAGMLNYNLNITATSPQLLSLNNLGNKGQIVDGIHTNSTNFAFNDTVSNGMIFKGTGKMIDTTFVISYILNDSLNNNGSDTCMIKIPR